MRSPSVPEEAIRCLNKLGPGQVTVDVQVDGIPTVALIDSGSSENFLSESFVKMHDIPLYRKSVPYLLTTADGSLIDHNQGKITEEATISLRVEHQVERLVIDATNIGKSDIILGLPWLRKNNPHIDWKTMTITLPKPRYSDQGELRFAVPTVKSLQRMKPTDVEVVCCYRLGRELEDKPTLVIPPEYKEFTELFEEEMPEESLPPYGPQDHEIVLKPGTHPKKFGIYPLNQKQRDALHDYIKDCLAKGWIRESKSPAGYPVFYVPKPDGSLRLCVDFRQLNEITVKNAYTLPLIQELRDRLQGAKYFTKFDIPAAFHRIRIKEGDEWKTAFRTHLGHYEYLVMPFGLTNAPATFQAYINNVLREYIDVFVCVYIDDILIYSRTLEQHVEHVRKVLRALKKHNLRLKPSKSEFHVQRTKFVGCVVSPDGIEVDPDKIKKVEDWPEPLNTKDVQSFVGFANYYRQFIRGFSGVAAPLTKLMSSKREFSWDEPAQKAFEELKRLLTSTPVLQLFDPDKPCTVETDASDYALGGVLSQPGSDGKLRPVAFHGRKFNSAETRYSTADKELLAIVDSMKHWRYYLEGAKHVIQVYTDHANLRNFTTTKELNSRQLRWSDALASYSFRVSHRSGKLNANADALSRRADFQDKDKVKIKATLFREDNGDLVHQAAQLTSVDTLERSEDVYVAQQNEMGHFCDSVRIQEKLGLDNGTTNNLYTKDKLIWIPPKLEKDWIRRFHEPPLQGHARPEVVLERIQRNYWFPQMRQKIFNQIRKCHLCRKAKYERHKPYGLLQPNSPPDKPWQVISMDFVGPLPPSTNEDEVVFENILVVVDRLTKYAEFIPLPRKYDAPYLAKTFIRHVVTRHGIPERIISDRDKLFTSNFWDELCEALSIKRALSTAYHPQSDGQTERMNQNLEQYLRLYVNDEQSDWASLLNQAAFAYNVTKQQTIGMTPFFANFGREPRLTTGVEEYLPTDASVAAKDLQALHQQLRSDIEFLNKRMAMNANKKRIEGPILKEGDKVYLWRRNIKTKRQNSKLDFLKLGPFKVKSVKGPVNYELQLPKAMRIHPVFHVSLLEPADAETPLENQVELDESTMDQEYEVERILQHSGPKGRRKYLIRWLGYSRSEDSWEPEKNLHKDLVRDYWYGQAIRQRPKPEHFLDFAALARSQNPTRSKLRNPRSR